MSRVYQAYVNRASSGELDNHPLIDQILKLRGELADLLGYANFADYTLEENMVGSSTKAPSSLKKSCLKQLSRYWQGEVEALNEFATKLGHRGLASSRPCLLSPSGLRKEQFELDEEELRPYFPLDRVSGRVCMRLPGAPSALRLPKNRTSRFGTPTFEFYEVSGRGGHPPGLLLRRLVPPRGQAGGGVEGRVLSWGDRAGTASTRTWLSLPRTSRHATKRQTSAA